MQRQRGGGPHAAKPFHRDGAHEGAGWFNGGAGGGEAAEDVFGD